MGRSDPLFVVHPSSGVPIYRQLVDQVEALVAGGRLLPGDLVPSVRQVAAALGVNPMTVSKAWGRLESLGVLERVRGRGMVVAERRGATLDQRRDEVRPLLDRAVVRALHLGLTPAQVERMVRESLEENGA